MKFYDFLEFAIKMATISSSQNCCYELRKRLRKFLAVVHFELAFAISRCCKSSKIAFTQADKNSKLSCMITKIDVDVNKT